jgi:hypothetical protein
LALFRQAFEKVGRAGAGEGQICVLGRLPAADTHSVEAGILSDVLLQ